MSLSDAITEIFTETVIDEFSKLLGLNPGVPLTLSLSSPDSYKHQICLTQAVPISRYLTKSYTRTVFSVSIDQFPGCCGALIVHDLNVYDTTERLLQLAENIGRLSGYSTIYYSTIRDQFRIIEGLEKEGYKSLHTYSSQRTGNDITLWHKQIASCEDRELDEDDDD